MKPHEKLLKLLKPDAPDLNIGIESLESPELFRTRKGIIKVGHLLNPRFTEMESLRLPKGSVFMYIGQGQEDSGPTINHPFFVESKKKVPTYHVLEYTKAYGNVRVVKKSLEEPIRKYHHQNREFKRFYQLEKNINDIQVPFLINLSFPRRQYEFLTPTKTAAFNAAMTTWHTAIDTLNSSLQANPDFEQFVLVETPSVLLDTSTLRIMQDHLKNSNKAEMTLDDKAHITNLDYLVLFDLFLWAGKYRQFSLLSKFDINTLKKINIVIKEGAYAVVVNLGILDSFRKSVHNPKGLEPPIFQLKILQLYIALCNIRNSSPEEIEALNKQALEDELKAEKEKEEEQKELEKTIFVDPDFSERDELDDDLKPDEDDPKDPSEELSDEEILKQLNESNKNDKIVEFDEDRDVVQERNLAQELSEEERERKELKLLEEQIEQQMALLTDHVEKEKIVEASDATALIEEEHQFPTPEKHVEQLMTKLFDNGNISPNDFKRHQRLANAYKDIKTPLQDKDIKLDEYVKIIPEDVKVEATTFKDKFTVLDKNMNHSTLKTWKSKYIEKSYLKDASRMVLALQQAGICLTNFNIEKHEDAGGAFYHFVCKVKPVIGQAGTLRFKLPVMDEEGTFTANGTSYFQRSQMRDKPIRKVSPTRVALTSYYGKVFIDRSEKRIHNYGRWLCSAIRAASLDRSNSHIRDTRSTSVFDPNLKLPYIYTTLAKEFKTIETANYLFLLDYKNREKAFGEPEVKLVEQGDYIACGVDKQKNLIVVNTNNEFFLCKKELTKVNYEPIGDIHELMQIPIQQAPLETAEISVMGKVIPVGMAIAYHDGLSTLLKRLGVKYRIIPTSPKNKIENDEYMLQFHDSTLVFKRKDRLASIMLSGFLDYQLQIKDYNLSMFDSQEVYLNVLESKKITVRSLNEVDLMYQMFIDPITLEILKIMKEPIHFRGLLIRACELLLVDYHPNEVDASEMRITGVERIPGAVYSELVRTIRYHNNRGISAQYPLSLNPNVIWTNISRDPSVMVKRGLNPIANLKELESVTFSGTGGRSSESMVERTRIYDKNSLGSISESTVDSGSVGINVYMSANPSVTNIYGMTEVEKINPDDPNFARLMSTSSNLHIATDRDDSKRRAMTAIMNDHKVPCAGYQVQPLRTGYEQIVAHRVGKMFAYSALEDGEVIEVTKQVLKVRYKSGKEDTVRIGRTYGSDGGLTVPHANVSRFKAGDKFSKDDILTYNPAFFSPDPLDNNTVSWKMGALARVLLCENAFTIEDSSIISPRLSGALKSFTTKVKNITVNFKQELHRFVKVGEKVDVDTFLCFIEDDVTNNAKLFDEESIEALKALAAQAPKAGIQGVVERIEVFYNGDKEDMSDSLRELANQSDKNLIAYTRATGKPYIGRVGSDFRVEGKGLMSDTAVIRVYMTAELPAHTGDKGVFANQLKSVFGGVWAEEDVPYTEDGEQIDALFGAKSVQARIVQSVYVMGTTNSLLLTIGKNACDIYFNRKKNQ